MSQNLCLRCGPKSCERNAIPTHLVFQCIDVIVLHLSYVINVSLSTGIVSEILKAAMVQSLIKKAFTRYEYPKELSPNIKPVFSFKVTGESCPGTTNY